MQSQGRGHSLQPGRIACLGMAYHRLAGLTGLALHPCAAPLCPHPAPPQVLAEWRATGIIAASAGLGRTASGSLCSHPPSSPCSGDSFGAPTSSPGSGLRRQGSLELPHLPSLVSGTCTACIACLCMGRGCISMPCARACGYLQACWARGAAASLPIEL